MRVDLGKDDEPEIGLIALIDCIFFLLMFFMVATSFKQQDDRTKEQQLPIKLPSAEIALDRAEASPDPLVIGVTKDGRLFLDGQEVTVAGLHERLHQEAENAPGRPVRIDGDRAATYQDIVHVLDLCQFEHLTNISMHTLR